MTQKSYNYDMSLKTGSIIPPLGAVRKVDALIFSGAPHYQKEANTMPRAKHPKLPNGFGSIKKLSGNRSNPYAVYPPTTEYRPNGSPISPKALCYVPDWYTGFYALMEYRKGAFDPEKFIENTIRENEKGYNAVRQIIAAYNSSLRHASDGVTFSDVYALFYNSKFGSGLKSFSPQTRKAYAAAYKNSAVLHNIKFSEVRKDEMQSVLDGCKLGFSSVRSILNLFRQMSKYALENGIIDRDYSCFVNINQEDNNEKGEPFTAGELEALWQAKEDPDAQIVLILIYSGMRISELQITTIDLAAKTFQGGLKTKSGKGRVIPIHDIIFPFVSSFDQGRFNANTWRDDHFHPLMKKLGMTTTANGKKHTPHDCRHTFSWLADKYKVDELSKHMIMGHSLGRDVERTVYGHRTLDELRMEINKIEI